MRRPPDDSLGRAPSRRGLRIAYMTGQYPRATDTFIQREVAALAAHGRVRPDVLRAQAGSAKENVGPEQQAERAGTFYVLPARLTRPDRRRHATAVRRQPRRYLSALKTALTVRPAGAEGAGLAGGVLSSRPAWSPGGCVRHGLCRTCTTTFPTPVARWRCWRRRLGGFTFSFTMHGPAEFYEPKYWRIDEKIRRALFVACISQFCRSQAMVFAPQACWDKLHVVHCGVNPADFAPSPGRRYRRRHPGCCSSAAWRRSRDLPILLEALATLRRRTPASEADRRRRRARPEALAAQARDAWGRARCASSSATSRRSRCVRCCRETDVFVMASFAEGVPVVLMEAMAAGVPVVATQIAGVPELVEDGVSGFLVPPGDADGTRGESGPTVAESDN